MREAGVLGSAIGSSESQSLSVWPNQLNFLSGWMASVFRLCNPPVLDRKASFSSPVSNSGLRAYLIVAPPLWPFFLIKKTMATPVLMPKTLCLSPDNLGLSIMSPPRSSTQISANSRATTFRKPAYAPFANGLRPMMKAMTPSSFTRSDAQRTKRVYMS